MYQTEEPRVLLVDDDVRLLESLTRLHGRSFDIVTATGGHEGIRAIERDGPFAVIVVDRQMPDVDGFAVLARAQKVAPETTRMMLTGQAELDTAVTAVNEGQVFRFLTKPCSARDFALSVEAGIRQHLLVRNEREILDRTVRGSIQALVDVLSLSCPVAFARARRVEKLTLQIAARLELHQPWLYGTAALLSQLGIVSVPPRVLQKAGTGQLLSLDEQEMLERHVLTAAEILRAIPKLEPVANVLVQEFELRFSDRPPRCPPEVLIGAKILHAAFDLDELLGAGLDAEVALSTLESRGDHYGNEIIAALRSASFAEDRPGPQRSYVGNLPDGWFFAEDLCDREGEVLFARGQQVSPYVRARVANYLALGELEASESVLLGQSLTDLGPFEPSGASHRAASTVAEDG